MNETWRQFSLRTGREYFTDLMRRHDWDVAKAAVEAGKHRTDMYRLLGKFGVMKPPKRVIVASRMSHEFRRFLGNRASVS